MLFSGKTYRNLLGIIALAIFTLNLSAGIFHHTSQEHEDQKEHQHQNESEQDCTICHFLNQHTQQKLIANNTPVFTAIVSNHFQILTPSYLEENPRLIVLGKHKNKAPPIA